MQLMKQVRRNSTRSSRTVVDRDCELTDWQVALGGLGGFEHQVGNFKKLKDLPPEKQTYDNGTSTMNKDLFNYFLWNMVIFQCHVSFQGCNSSSHFVTELQLYCRRCYKMLVLLQLLQPTCAKVRVFLKCWKNAFGFGIGTRGYELLRPLLYLTSSSLKSRFHLQ